MTRQNTRRMIGVFIGQLILVASLVAFADYLPSWSIALATTAVVLLPLIAYFTILAEPAVYRAWGSALRETWDFGRASVVSLWRCLSVRNTVRVWQSIVSLKVFPDTGDAWVALSLFPFKLYVLMATPFLLLARWLYRLLLPQFAYLRFPEATRAISEGYLFCLGVLLVGALVQALFSSRGHSTQTMRVMVLGVVFFYVLRPWGMFGR